MKTAIKSAAGLIIIAILAGMNGCMFYPVSKKDVIGTYEAVLPDGTFGPKRGLPDGGSEILELREDGTCIQKVALKDGRTFAAQGTWEWDADPRYVGNQVIIMGIYEIVDPHDTDKIRIDIEKTRGRLMSYPIGRDLVGSVILGSTEYSHYEKK